MSRKRQAFADGMAQADITPPVDTTTLRPGGNWSRMAFEEMDKRLKEAGSALERAEEASYQGILEGVVPISIPRGQIIDEIGSDRFTSEVEGDTESLSALIDNIRRRGLRTPLRVRPKNPDWRPRPSSPRDVGDEVFILQSGRRRLEACRHLGIDPFVFLSFVDAQDAYTEDLHERFFENATRKNLTAIEKLYSIGLIAKETIGTSQAQIAEIIGTSTSQVSRGLAVVEYFPKLKVDLDLEHVSRDDIDAVLKIYREADAKSEVNPKSVQKRTLRSQKKASLPFRKRQLKQGEAKLRIDGEGRRVLTLTDARLDDARIDKILSLLEDG